MTPTKDQQSVYAQWLESCRQADIPAISTDTAARLMAVLYEYGNNEGFIHNQKFLADKDYIQQRFGLYGGGVVEHEFHILLKGYIKELQEYQEAHKDDKGDGVHIYRPIAPDWAPRLLKERYDMAFIG